MQKILKISLFTACIVLLLALVAQTLYNLDKNLKNQLAFKEKNTTIENLKDTINQLEEKEKQLEEVREQTKKDISRLENDLDFQILLNEGQRDIDRYFSWIKDSNWNKVTLTNSSGKNIDITDNEIFKRYFLESYGDKFEYKYMMNFPLTTNAYTYRFYFDNEIKEITISLGGLIRAYNAIDNVIVINELCKSTLLYNVAEALLPIEDSFKRKNYNAKELFINSEVQKVIIRSGFPTNPESGIYSETSHVKYIILDWIPKYMTESKELPEDINTSVYEFIAYYNGEEAHFKIYKYSDILGYFMELSYKNESIIYKRNNVPTEFDLEHILQMSVI